MTPNNDVRFGVFHIFAGIGGGALGFQDAQGEWRGLQGRYRTLGGVDVDADACADFESLTGAPATCMDLFDRQDYAAFHGREPSADWREATPEDLRAAAGGGRPDVIFTSPPCKGFSALLPKAQADSAKYEALNHLTVRGVWLALEAWADDLPGLFILENVPRITSRGRPLLDRIHALLRAYGYEVQEGLHDVGEVGGLAQHRRRYLLVARQPDKVTSFLYRPPQRKVRAIGDVLETLPLPDDPAGGPMHRLPRLNWLTWVRLALIPAGGDWRDLQGVEPGSYGIVPANCPHFNHVMKVTPWDQPAGAVAGGGGPSQGAVSVADPRLSHEPRKGVFGVTPWDEPAGTITAAMRATGSNVAASVADPRLQTQHGEKFKGSPGLMGVMRWDGPSAAVTGSAAASSSNMPAAVADPRGGPYGVVSWDTPAGTVTGNMRPSCGTTPASVADPRIATDNPGRHHSKFRVERWTEPAHTVAGSDRVGSGAHVVADPRIPGRPDRHAGDLAVRDWTQPAATVTGEDSVGSGAQSVTDPRLGCTPRSGAYRVVRWDEAAPTVTGSGDVHAQGAAAVADPRLPADGDQGVWVIVSEDGTWHRPLTTMELAALQGFPVTMPDGRPLTLAGKSQAKWRERIGNAVPPPAARAIGDAMMQALLPSTVGAWTLNTLGTAVWVRGLWRFEALLRLWRRRCGWRP